MIEADSSSFSSLMQSYKAVPGTTMASLWRVLFMFLAWTVSAERRKAAELASAGSMAAREAAKQAMEGVPSS
jgi:hypothetical protein